MNELKSVASFIEVTTSFKTTLVAAVGKIEARHHQLQLSVKHNCLHVSSSPIDGS